MRDGTQLFRVVLASASPRRSELLTQAGYWFAVEAADVDESLRDGETADAYVRRLAEEKAQAVMARHLGEQGGILVVGADTCVVCDSSDGEQILGKPCDVQDAMRMLQMLSGRVHRVLTGVAVATPAAVESGVEETRVTFATIPEAELNAYCATGEPLDKAGAYGIQGYAARWIPRIEGCYFNVMGLPIARTVEMLQATSRGHFT